MSAVRFEHPLYKVYEPAYHSQRPIIVDEAIESPETVTLRYEEEVARANGGDHRGESPPGLLPMSAYKPQPPQLHGFAESSYPPYSPQSFSAQQSDNAASQMSQMAFAANTAASQYMESPGEPSSPTSMVTVISCHPSAGIGGTKILLKVSSQYDLLAVSNPETYAYIIFGGQRCPAQIHKDVGDSSTTYTITSEAPQFVVTNYASPSNVPLALVLEGASGEEIARVDGVGVFTYHDVQTGGSGDTGSHEDMGTRNNPQSPAHRGSPPHSGHGPGLRARDDGTSPPSEASQILQTDSDNTNTYGYPPGVAVGGTQTQTPVQPNFSPASYSQGNENMLGAYRTSSFADHYPRSSVLRSPHVGWTTYGTRYGSARSPVTSIAHSTHTTITRPGLTPLSQPSGAPQLIRTSTLQAHSGGGGSAYNPFALFPNKAQLKINGDLDSMASDWTTEELENRRRIVLFKRSQHGSQLSTSFRPVSVNERPPNSVCISCIWWAEKRECFVTSVDTIHLLEQLLAAPARFTVEEKNRIRRNLEGFHPLTVSKAKAESEEFFKVIMSFGNPKPRNIEKDVKVFPWKILSQALKKITSKYSATPSSTLPPAPSAHHHLMTPVSVSASYPALPPTPGPTTTATDPITVSGYVSSTNSAHHNALLADSQRPLPGTAVSLPWTSAPPYGSTPGRTLSPGVKTISPQPNLRISTLHDSYSARASGQPLSSPYALSSPATHQSPHHATHASSTYQSVPVSQSHSTRSWDSYAAVADSYATHTATTGHGHAHTHTHTHSGVYDSAAAYGDGGPQRA